jgi:tellurite resistance protein TerC
MDVLFAFTDYWSFYAAFLALVLVLLAVDLGVFHREAHVVTFRESLAWSVVWVTVALAFNWGFYLYSADRFGAETGARLGLEFLTGYVVEKSLAVDNIFVFVLVFAYFGIPAKYQHRVLFYGIIGALVFRAVFIALGSVLMQYSVVVLLFGVLLLLTGVKMLLAPEQSVDPGRNPVIRLFKKIMPITPDLHGQRFVVRLNGRWHATPLFAALLFLELSDVIFAVDSVPAIFAITSEPFIVFTSNVFAILGLRSMYFMLAGAIDRFYLLKMVWLNDLFGGKFPIGWSLGIIAALLAAGIGASLWWRPAPRATRT